MKNDIDNKRDWTKLFAVLFVLFMLPVANYLDHHVFAKHGHLIKYQNTDGTVYNEVLFTEEN